MLLAIRERSKGWVIWVLGAAIIVPLAFFGLDSYFQGPPASELAVVNGTEITADQVNRAYEAQRRRLEEMIGSRLDPAMFDEQQMRRQALDRLIDQALLHEYVQREGLRISDATLASILFTEPGFQANGKFSSEVYQSVLRSNGLTPAGYEAQVRVGEAVNQLQGGVYGSAFVTDQELTRLLNLERQQRELAYLTVAAADFRGKINLSEAEIESFYEQNKALFQRPEEIKLGYLELSREALAKTVSIPEDELRARYEELKNSQYTQGGERRVRHILLELPKDATAEQVAQATERLAALRGEIESGKLSFEDAAKQQSQDTGSAQQGGDLGQVSRGTMVEEFERAAFALKKGELSEPVRTPFGLHLIQVTELNPEKVQPFEQVRDQLRQEMSQGQLDNRMIDLGNRLANLAYEHPDSLQPAAEKLGLPLQQTDWIVRGGQGEGIAANAEVLKAAFSEDVLGAGRNSDVITLQDGRQLVIRIQEHKPAEQRPLPEVAEQVRDQLLQQRAAESARELGGKLEQQMVEGGTPEAIAKSDSAGLTQPGFVGRGSAGVPPAVLREAFELPKPTPEKPSVGGVQLANGDYVALRVSAVREAPAGEDGAKVQEAAEGQLRGLYGEVAVRGLLQALRADAEIEIRENRL